MRDVLHSCSTSRLSGVRCALLRDGPPLLQEQETGLPQETFRPRLPCAPDRAQPFTLGAGCGLNLTRAGPRFVAFTPNSCVPLEANAP